MTNDSNARPGGPGGGLASEARELLAGSRWGVLATLVPEAGTPYASLVEVLPLPHGDAIMLLSGLAEHRRYLDADPRASLLVTSAHAAEDPLTAPRLTLVGNARLEEDPAAVRGPYLELHPGAAAYVDFPDFAFYRLRVARARFIAGFGRMGWIEGESYRNG